jgi:phosphatidylserine/phosphatidylglycerophosphate/cardiolipin synthase-like enzyme
MRRVHAITIPVLILAAVLGGFAGAYLAGQPPPVAASGDQPDPGSVRVLYSLDDKENDQALISLIDNARDHVYFAIYEFTLTDVADALVRAKMRGIDVRGIVDRENSTSSYESPIIDELTRAGIPLVTQRQENGIMHIKALVTERAYASGSYNWTHSATTENDEVLEIGTDPGLRARYETILTQVIAANAGSARPRDTLVDRTYDYTEASAHIGETAAVRGTVVDVYTSASGTTFFDYCRDYDNCPFSAVIFPRDKDNFVDLSQYDGRTITVSGRIASYEERAEIVLHHPDQIDAR